MRGVKIILIGAMLLRLAVVHAGTGGPITVAVYDFVSEGNSKVNAAKMMTLVTAELAEGTNFAMVERAQLNKALSEQAFGSSGMVNSDAAARVGQITGAQVLISGHLFMTGKQKSGRHVTIVANIIGTETARLFAAKVDGMEENMVDLATNLSAKISKIIVEQATNLIVAPPETAGARIQRIVDGISGTNRPSVSVGFHFPKGPQMPSFTANTEMSLILQKAGFPVVDENSEHKPDIEITGVVDGSGGPKRGELHTEHTVIEMKVQDRRTGAIIRIDRQESVAVDPTRVGAQRNAQALAIDELAARTFPLLAK